MKFDIIVGNPPYNNPRERSNGSSLWPEFMNKSISLLKDGGYLCFVHPSGWRRLESDLWLPMTKNQIHYLEIHGLRDGQKMFNCLTRYDWYVLEKVSYNKPTIICDEKKIVSNIDLREYKWLPNSHTNIFEKLYSTSNDNKCNIIHSNDYRTDKPWISREKRGKFKYPVMLGINEDGQRLCYSSKKMGHFGISKVICNGSGFLYPFNDFDGKFGMNKFCFGLPVSSREEGEEMIKALNSHSFKELVEAMKCSGYYVDHKVFQLFKKDFWKEFI